MSLLDSPSYSAWRDNSTPLDKRLEERGDLFWKLLDGVNRDNPDYWYYCGYLDALNGIENEPKWTPQPHYSAYDMGHEDAKGDLLGT